MKKFIAVVMMLLFVAVSAGAVDMMVLKAKNGDVTFNHKAHGDKVKCDVCHGGGTPGKMKLGGQAKAHKLCQDCHKEKKAGPTKCMECHKKK